MSGGDRKRLAGSWLLPALVALALAGCGSSSGQTTETVARLTKPQLVKKLDDICQQHTERQVIAIERFDKAHGIPYGLHHENATDADLERELVVVILPIVEDTIHELTELQPSVQQEADFKGFVHALEHGVAASRKDPSWVATGSTEPFAQARELSGDLGTALCGQA